MVVSASTEGAWLEVGMESSTKVYVERMHYVFKITKA